MLEYLRNAAEKPIAKILIGILAFSFVGWGVAEWIFGNVVQTNTLMTVGGDAITVEDFNAEKSHQLAAMGRDQQKQIYTNPAAAATLTQGVIATLMNNKMVARRAAALGFVVTDRRVAREIREFPEFQMNGQFSTYMFDAVLAQAGYSEASFADYLRGQIMRSMTLGSVSVPVATPKFAVQAAYDARNGQRKIEYATVKYADIKTDAPSDDELREFYAKNPRTIAESRDVAYVLVPGQMDRPDVYDAAMATAQKIEDALIGGDAMKDVAAQNKAQFGMRRGMTAGAAADKVLTADLVARAMTMDEGIESEIIETPAGLMIMRVEKIVPAHAAEFKDVKQDLIADWRRDRQRRDAYVRANELLVDLNAGKGLRGKKAATVTRTTGAPTDVLVAAFAGAPGGNSIVSGTDAFYVVHIGDAIAPKADAKATDALKTEVQNMTTRMLMDDYNAFLMREYPVKVNTKTFNKFLGQ
ncbi:hypothetical protein HDR63_01080 [bacterium]|nr:hypothetical protein [bacterium]